MAYLVHVMSQSLKILQHAVSSSGFSSKIIRSLIKLGAKVLMTKQESLFPKTKAPFIVEKFIKF